MRAQLTDDFFGGKPQEVIGKDKDKFNSMLDRKEEKVKKAQD
jgi:hypothetical protein